MTNWIACCGSGGQGGGISLETISGNVCTFNSQYALPLKSHKIALTATQSGSGAPSPDNVRTINGYSAIGVRHSGVNIWGGIDLANDIKAVNNNAVIDSENKTVTFNANQIGALPIFSSFKPNTVYTIILSVSNSNNTTATNLRVNYTDNTRTPIVMPISEANLKQTVVVTTAETKSVSFINGVFASGATTLWYDECGIFEGALSADDFVAYNGHSATIQIGSTVYGGEYDARTGVFVVMGVGGDLGSLTWTYISDGLFRTPIISGMKTGYSPDWICEIYSVTTTTDYSGWANKPNNTIGFLSTYGHFMVRDDRYTDANDLKTALNGVKLVYELATPQTIQLPPCPIDTLEGENNIWADTGTTSLTYIDAGESGGGDEPIKMIVSTGAQRIDLPYYSDDGIKLKFKMFLGYVNQNGVIFGDEWSAAGILLYTEGQTLELRVIGNVETNIPLPAYHIADVEFDYTTGILSIDGNTYGSYTLGGHKPICLFGLTSGHQIWGALSDISIEQNGTEVMKLVAKKDAQTGAGYYYDEIGGQDYYSVTGTDLLYTEI